MQQPQPPRLPPEVVLVVLRSCRGDDADLGTLRACALVSRTWHALSSEVIYEDLDLRWLPPAGLALLRALKANSSLPPLVRGLKVDFPHLHDWIDIERIDGEIRDRAWEEQISTLEVEDEDAWRSIKDDEEAKAVFQGDLDEDEINDEIREDGIEEAKVAEVMEWMEGGREEGAAELVDLITSLPSLVRLELTNFDWGPLPPLPTVEHLSLESDDPDPVVLPLAPNLKHLRVAVNLATLALPPNFAVPRLHTLEVHVQGQSLKKISAVLPLITPTLHTLHILATPPNNAAKWAAPLARILTSAARTSLEVLKITHVGSTDSSSVNSTLGIDAVSTLLEFLAGSTTLRELDVAVQPSPLLARNLPVTIEKITIAGSTEAEGLQSFLKALLREKRTRLHNLSQVRAGAGADGSEASPWIEEGRELGLDISIFTRTER